MQLTETDDETRCAAPAEESPDDRQERLVALWALRILVRLGGLKGLRAKHLFNSDTVLEAVGCAHLAFEEIARPEAGVLLQARLAELEASPPPLPAPLVDNLAYAAEVLELSEAEQRILAFAAVMEVDQGLDDTGDTLGQNVSREYFAKILAVTLDVPLAEIYRSLSPQGRLLGARLCALHAEPVRLAGILQLMPGLGYALRTPHAQPGDLFAQYLRPAAACELALGDFAHVAEDLRLLESELGHALKHREQGCNILLYGPSGTGKTQLARALAAALGAELFEVHTEGDSHERFGAQWLSSGRLHPELRADAFQLSQRLLARRANCLLLFDEIEDVFPAGLRGLLNHAAPPKGWLSNLLESNPVPAIWVSNSIWQLDPAAARRFSLVVELGNPTRAVRARLLQNTLGDTGVRASWLGQMADNEHLSPALIAKVARSARTLAPQTPEALEASLERVLGNTLQAMGLPRRSRLTGRTLTRYRLDCLNPDQDVAAIAEGLGRTGRGRLCLYGPPGTGKTAFAEHVARSLDRPLLVRRASDLLSKWLGETEQHIEAMFRAAQREQAVLLLDEADSFLRDRAGAHHGWEVTQVNELLTQMEDFDGVFIAATNLMETLDAAALRRFDLKVRFDYLRPAQARSLFEQLLAENGVQARLDDLTCERLSRLDRLTPGDFATVIRRFAVTGAPWTPDNLLAALRAEQQAKPGTVQRPIGFATSA